jgi:hypothetical protein
VLTKPLLAHQQQAQKRCHFAAMVQLFRVSTAVLIETENLIRTELGLAGHMSGREEVLATKDTNGKNSDVRGDS